MSKTVLDASAILAFLQEEPGQEIVAEVLERGVGIVSAVNLSETAAKLTEAGMSREETTEVLRELDLQMHLFDETQAMECAWLREPTRAAGLSLGDRACLALAKHLALPVLTTDRSWTRLTLGVTVLLARP